MAPGRMDKRADGSAHHEPEIPYSDSSAAKSSETVILDSMQIGSRPVGDCVRAAAAVMPDESDTASDVE